MPTIRYIDTAGLPEGFDVADLIEQGIEGDALLEWCRERVRPGIPDAPKKVRPASAPPPEDDATRGPKVSAKPTRQPSAVNGAASNVVSIAAARKPEPEPDFAFPPEYSEDALAKAFTEKYSDGLIYVTGWNTWFLWDDTRWKRDDTQLAVDLSRGVCRKFADQAIKNPNLKPDKQASVANALSSARTFANVERVARADRKHAGTTEQWDLDPFTLNTKAGVIDLRTGMARPARRDDYCTKIVNAAPRDGCQLWREFLKVATDGDDELAKFMQRVAGYCLTGSTQEQVFFFVYGLGGNGKGTYMNTLYWLLNDYAANASMDLFTEKRFGNDEAAIAGLHGARLVTAQETEQGKRWNESRLCAFTGNDPIQAKFLYSNPFTFMPQFKLLFAGNHKPSLRSINDAIKRRLYLVPFTVTIPAAKRDPMLPMKLREEAGGILQWAIDGCLDWQRNTLAPPERVLLTTGEYFEEQDTLGQFFEECTTAGPRAWCRSDLLYRKYVTWAEAAGEYVMSRALFLQAIAYKGMVPVKSMGVKVIKGIAVDDGSPRTQPHGDGDLL